ncbi:oxygen-regulated protein 1-like [Oncorhynchus nerka]|uniref:oxygen-regulated protein 1-like n=1 Tax=Oncorhynchus nerka TaxID=8023 RepID=UPI0031B854CE
MSDAQDQFSGSGHTVTTSRHPYITDPIASKRICFYKSGDPQFSGLRMVINNRTFKTFDALLDSLSKKVPLPFGVRNITTPRGVHAVHTLDELEDGKAYICSDQRKVKPINMAVANKKLPPWYNARPMSARRRALQLAKQNPGRPMHINTPVRTPKRLMVFQNGDPSVKHNLMLQKRTTRTFEALLDYLSELMHFPVVKLHTPDGRRVDGLPALIICSGIVVAAGREAFKSGNYKTQKSSASTWLPARRMASKRLKQPASRKKKPISSGKSKLFSPSSERYFVNQINHCIAGSECDLPSNNAESVELEAGHFLESVAETDGDSYHGDRGEGADNCIPGDDDIEKSFRVNQDGSMTVEMKVRLTIREEETIHWTTTLSRSSVANQLSAAESELENSSPESNILPPTQPNTMGTINGYNVKKDDHDDKDDMPPETSRLTSVEVDNEDDTKTHVGVVSPRRAPTPGPRRYRQKQASVESLKTILGDEIQENMVGSNSYRETTENGEVKEEYRMVRQCSSKPVPKPRGVGSVDINNYNKTQSTFKSGMAEILQIQNGGEEVIESVMHIYEQQTCQDNFLANSQYNVQGVSIYGMMYGRTATSDTAHLSSRNDLELELGRPSTASKSISVWRADQSLSSEFTIPKFKAGGSLLRNRVLNVHKTPLSMPTKDNDTPEWVSEASKENSTTGVKKVKKMFSKPKVKKNQVRKVTTPDKRRKESNENAPGNNKRVKTGGFSSNVSVRKMYGPKHGRSLIKNKKKLKGKEIYLNIENPKESAVKELHVTENRNKTSVSVKKNVLHVTFPTEAQVDGTLKRQRSMHEERRIDKESHDLSSSNINEYVENWLEKALPTVYPDPVEETQNVETPTMSPVETEGDIVPDVSEFNCEMDTEEDEPSLFKEITQTPSSLSLETTAFPNRTFENIATQTNLALENTTLPCPSDQSSQKTPLHSDTTQERLPINPSVEKTLFSNGLSVSPTSIILVEKPSPSDSHSLEETSMPKNISEEKPPITNGLSLENKSVPNSSSIEKTPVSNSLSPEKTQLPAKTQMEKAPLSNKDLDVSSIGSSPSYFMYSSPSSLGDEEQPLSSSPSSNKAPSPTGHVFEKTTLFNHSTLKEPPSPKLPTKKTRLVSNLILEKQLTLRKASAEKSSISSDLTVEKVLMDKAPISNGLSSEKTSLLAKTRISNIVLDEAPLASSPSCFMSTSPTSLTSDERPISTTGHVLEKTTLFNHSTLKGPSTPKLPMKKKPIPPSPTLVNHEEMNGDDKLSNSDQGDSTKVTAEEPLTKTQIPSHTDKLPPQPDMKPVLEKLCFSIQSIRQITHNNRPSCLEKSKSLPDFSSHVASTFGSSTKALLSFLSVITLKESFTNWNIPELNANSVSCAEALKMMESLREIANMEGAEELKASLSELQKSTSTQLLQSWKGFQELNSKVRSRSSTPNSSEHNVSFETCPEKDYIIEEKSLDIDELIHELDLPGKLKEALAALPTGVSESMVEGDEIEMSKEANKKVSFPEERVNAKSTAVPKEEASNDNVLNIDANVDVKSIVKRFINIYHPKEVTENKMSPIPESQSSRQEQPFSSEEQDFKEDFTCHRSRQAANKEGSELEQDNWEEEAKCSDKQIDHDKEQTYSDIEQAYSLALHDGYLELQACPLKTKVKDGDIQSSYVEEEESLEEEQEYYIENALVEQENKCMELQLSNEDGQSTAEQTRASSNQHEESEVTLVELKVSREEEESLEGGQEYYTENPHVEQEIKCMELQVSCKESLEKDQASSEEEQECHVEDQLSYMVSENRCMEDECLEEEQQCHIEDQPSYVGLQVSYEERVSSLKEQATSEEEYECHIEDQPNHEEPEVKCLALQDSSEDGKSTPEEDQAISDEELEHHVENQPNHEDTEIKCMDAKVSSEESMSNLEEQQASSEEELECHIENQSSHEEKWVKCMKMQVSREKIEFTPEEDKASLGEEEESHEDDLSYAKAHINVQDEQTHLWVKQTTQKETECTVRETLPRLFKQHSIADRMDKDSGKNSAQHVSFEQQTDTAEEANFEDNQCSSEEKRVSYEEKLSSSDVEHVSVEDEPYPEEEYQETLEEEPSEEDKHYEKTEAKTTNCFEEPLPSVAERVKILDKKIADVKQGKSITIATTGIKPFGQIEVSAVSGGDDAKEQDKTHVHTFKRTTWPINTSETVVMSPPAPRSLLAFSYDGCITREPDGNRVKSIKELFIAKSVVDNLYGQTRLPSQNTSDLSDNRPETSGSGGHQSQTSTETSSGEDDSVKKSITKCVVRRTIERLYGKKDTNVKDRARESQPPPSPLKPKSREFPGKISLSPFHNAQTKGMSDLSYFNATSSVGTYSDPTRYVAFNAQVEPGDCFLIDKDRWLLRESVIRKSVSEPIDINKNTSASTEDVCKDTEEDVPYSLFGHTDLEDIVKSVKPLVQKCTYFNLPHGCDSDPHQDDLSPVSKGSAKGEVSKDSKDKTEKPKLWAEKNGIAFAPTDFKMPDNKVHPLIEGPGGGKVVVVQPGKRQPGKGQTDVMKIPQEPDALEMLYFSCGQHCPIL